MSYRPTISVYINGRIADIGYYRNWDDNDLFYEAMAIAALFSTCKDIPEYNMKKFGKQKIYYSLEPVSFENTEENLKFFESCSEFPILVDLTEKCIYISEGAKSKRELLSIRSALEDHRNYGFIKDRRQIRPDVDLLLCKRDASGQLVDCDGNPVFEEYEMEIPAVNRISPMNIDRVMYYCRIPFDHVDMNEVLNLFRKEKTLWRHLSTGVIELLKKEKVA